MHQLMHLPKSIILQGPLWAHSCFGFESSMGTFKDLVKSVNGVPSQIATRVMMRSCLQASKATASACTQTFMNPKKFEATLGRVILLGGSKTLTQAVDNLVQQARDTIACPAVEHARVKISGQVLHRKGYGRPNKTDCTAVKLYETTYAKIENIVCFLDVAGKTNVFIVCQKCIVVPLFGTGHLKKVVRQSSKQLHEVNLDVDACIWIDCRNASYFCDFVNHFRSSYE